MEKELRTKKLEEVQKGIPYENIRLWYEGENKEFPIHKIPLGYLVYNKYNGRIASLVKSFEKQYRELDVESQEASEMIEKFLWASKEDRNTITMKSLLEIGQQKPGVVTNDGVVIDGNRRFMLLNKICSPNEREKWEKQGHNIDSCQFFIAAILPKNADPKEVSRLETRYQMGEDEKLDYNPIEKYLKCKDLNEKFDFNPAQIADMMGEKKSKIKEWLEIMKLMDVYLNYLGYDGIYTRLVKREGQFVDLDGYLKRYENHSSVPIDWGYDKSDISDLKAVCFDYIRAGYEGKEFRDIGRPVKKNEGIFCKENVWKEFLENHEKNIESIEEKHVEKLREENPHTDLSKLLQARDNEWTEQVKGPLKGNLNKSVLWLNDIKEADRPVDLLTKAIRSLESINKEHDSFYDEEVDELLKKMNSIAWQYRQLIKTRLKRNRSKK
jgi:hypothetical protein